VVVEDNPDNSNSSIKRDSEKGSTMRLKDRTLPTLQFLTHI
jgi:hypothetical protein